MSFFSSLKTKLFGPSVNYTELIENGALVIDVRSPQEFISGHAKKSKNIPLNVLKSKTASLKGKEIILVCKSGGRAGIAKSLLRKEGITANNLGPWQRAQNL